MLRKRIYSYATVFFLIAGFLVFAGLFFSLEGDSFVEKMTSIQMIAILLVSFVPASVLNLVSLRAEKKYKKTAQALSELLEEPPKKAAQKTG